MFRELFYAGVFWVLGLVLIGVVGGMVLLRTTMVWRRCGRGCGGMHSGWRWNGAARVIWRVCGLESG